ncbi:MAG: alpha/beta fold hydrolase [Pseudomonadota bacterium]
MRSIIATLLVVSALAGCAASAPVPVATPDVPLPDGVWSQEAMIASRDTQIPVTYVIPPSANEQALPLVLLVHGHGGTREEAGAFTRLAAQLAARGIASIRMDFPGCGESEEPFYNNNLTNMKADVLSAYEYVQRWAYIDLNRVGIVGFSMGGRIAAELSQDGERYAAMVLWAGALENGASEFTNMLGGEAEYAALKELARTEGYVPYETFWGQKQQLGAQWFDDLEASMPLDAIERYTGSLLLIHGQADEVVPPVVSRRAEAAAGNAAVVSLIEIPGADHGFGLFNDQPQFSVELIDQTVRFLSREL